MAIELPSRFWTSNPKERLRIRNADPSLKNHLVQQLLSGSPTKFDWPYGMPTSVNPWLLLIGISPGAAVGGGENIQLKRKEYVPTVGEPHPHFNSKRFWKRYGAWPGYWPKIRQLCAGLLRDRFDDDEEKVLTVCGHLNIGEIQTGTGDEKAINSKILRWVPDVVTERLRPHVVLLLGMKRHRKESLKSWKGTGFEFILVDPDEQPSFKCSDGKRRCFQVWNNPSPSSYPRKVIMLPNHPSRHPFTVAKHWESMIRQVKPIVFE
jgi:hypothetical protein